MLAFLLRLLHHSTNLYVTEQFHVPVSVPASLSGSHQQKTFAVRRHIAESCVIWQKVNKDTFEYITVLAVNPVWLIDPAISWHPVAVVIIRSSRS